MFLIFPISKKENLVGSLFLFLVFRVFRMIFSQRQRKEINKRRSVGLLFSL